MTIMPFITVPPNAGPDAQKVARQFDLTAHIAAIVCAFVVAVGVLVRAGVMGHPDPILDVFTIAGLAGLGIAVPSIRAVGQTMTNAKAAEAAHKRLDMMGAPPADDGTH